MLAASLLTLPGNPSYPILPVVCPCVLSKTERKTERGKCYGKRPESQEFRSSTCNSYTAATSTVSTVLTEYTPLTFKNLSRTCTLGARVRLKTLKQSVLKREVWHMHDEIVNTNEIRVVGLQRGGNHAVINWILSQCEGRICFLNYVRPSSNPFATAVQNRLPKFSSTVDVTRELEEPSKKDWLLYSYEDDDLGDVASDLFERNHDKYLGKSLRRFDVLILRDPFNFFASRLHFTVHGDPVGHTFGKTPLNTEENVKKLVGMWKMYAREFLEETAYLKHNKICVSFNHWFSEESYRRRLALSLGLAFTDAGLDECAVFSTFENTRDGQLGARGLRVLDRWRSFVDHSIFLRVTQDAELQDLSRRIFGSAVQNP